MPKLANRDTDATSFLMKYPPAPPGRVRSPDGSALLDDGLPEVEHRSRQARGAFARTIHRGFATAAEAIAFARNLSAAPGDRIVVELADGSRPYVRLVGERGGPDTGDETSHGRLVPFGPFVRAVA